MRLWSHCWSKTLLVVGRRRLSLVYTGGRHLSVSRTVFRAVGAICYSLWVGPFLFMVHSDGHPITFNPAPAGERETQGE